MIITKVMIDSLILWDVTVATPVITLTYPVPTGLFTSAAPRDESTALVDDDGSVDVTAYYEPREFTLTGKIRTTTGTLMAAQRDLLAKAFALGSLHTLKWTLEDGSTRQAYVRAASDLNIELIERSTNALWAIQCVAPNPLIFGGTVNSATLDPLSSGVGGMSFPAFPVDFVGPGSATISLTNAGNRSARPVYTMSASSGGAWVNPLVENATTGVRFYTTGLTIATGETAVIDTQARRFYYRGLEAPGYVDWDSATSWPVMPPGGNLIRAGGTPTTGALLQVDFRDTYI